MKEKLSLLFICFTLLNLCAQNSIETGDDLFAVGNYSQAIEMYKTTKK
jgi:hypothetical protein